MYNKSVLPIIVALAVPSIALVSCSEEDEPVKIEENGGEGSEDNDVEESDVKGKFVIACTGPAASSGTVSVLVTSETIDEGEVTIKNNGLSNDGATQWIFHGTDYLYALYYNQGNAGTTRSYVLGSDGEMRARNNEFGIKNFTSYGQYNDYIFGLATTTGPTEFADKDGNCPQTLVISYLDVINETYRPNDTSKGTYSMENLLGTGEYVMLSGAEQVGDRIYCGAVPMGLSPYGSNYENGKYIREGYEDLVATASGGSGGSSYTKGTLDGTQYPDSCWVAIYDNENFQNPIIARTDKISYATGRYRSQYYQTVWAVENGDVYVFSPSFAKTKTDDRQKTKRHAGVCRIKAGQTEFDDYYCDIEAISDGYTFMRCWPAGGSYFILAMYDTQEIKATSSATGLAIFDAEAKTFKRVTGIPESISSLGKTVYTHNGNVYIPINVSDGEPAIYRINPATAEAEKGITVTGATDINGFGYMTVAN